MFLKENHVFNDVESNQLNIKESFHGIDLQKIHTDEKTGFYVEDASLREAICKELTECILNEGNIAIVKFDLDNLKQVNDTIGRKAGDQMIIWSAEEVRNTLNDLEAGGARAIMCRQDHAGDEFIGYISGISQLEIKRLHGAVDMLNDPDKGNYTTVYSMKGSLKTSCDADYIDILTQEKKYLRDHPDRVGWRFINKMKKDIDDDIVRKKDRVLENKIKKILFSSELDFYQKKGALKKLLVGKRVTDDMFETVFHFANDSHIQNERSLLIDSKS